MSDEIYVLSDRQLGSIAEWQTAINRESFDLELSTDREFAALSGFLPARAAGGQATGFECDHWTLSDLATPDETVDFGHPWKFVLAFRFGRFSELEAAWMAASAYAAATDGIVFDPSEDKLNRPSEAAKIARDLVASPVTEADILELAKKVGLIR
jgi:hypothetical protein